LEKCEKRRHHFQIIQNQDRDNRTLNILNKLQSIIIEKHAYRLIKSGPEKAFIILNLIESIAKFANLY
jgi:hypothetical protein